VVELGSFIGGRTAESGKLGVRSAVIAQVSYAAPEWAIGGRSIRGAVEL
jgi:hypothetical protein